MLIEEEPDDQESNETTDTNKSMASSEIPKENAKEINTQGSSLQNEEEPNKPQESRSSLQNEEQPENPQAKESLPKKQVPKNVVTSWADWVAKTSTNVTKEAKENTSTSQSIVKR